MKRIFMVLAVAALMAAMMVASAMPAFAANIKMDDGGGPPVVSGDLDFTDNSNGSAILHCTALDPDSKGNVHFHKGVFSGDCS